jgi:predicted acetyltransferase
MKIELELIDISEKNVLSQMLNDYQTEISGESSVGYKYLDLYWERENRHPYFIKVDGEIAGFALINGHVIVSKGATNFAEFYVLPKFRKNSVGSNAAKAVFAMFPGKWEVRQIAENTIAHIFWNKVINEYTNGKFQEITMNNVDWNGWIQTF